MAHLSEKDIKKFKDIFEKESGKEMTYEEASGGANNLVGLMELLIKCDCEEQERKRRLVDFPKGFHLEGNRYSCFICGDSISNEETWYDEYGTKCLICQKAIDNEIIPGPIARDKDSWYSKYELENRLNINRQALKDLIKKNVLIPRNIPGNSGRTHLQIFLIEDNKDTLPPKELTNTQFIKEEKDGKTWIRPEPWYKFTDPYKHLKNYNIVNYIKFITTNN